MTLKQWHKLKYFKPAETFLSKDGTLKLRSFPRPLHMNLGTMQKLDKARGIYGGPLVVTSSYRPGDEKAHGGGYAVDVRVSGSMMRKKVAIAMHEAGFPRIGIYDGHVHGDTDPDLPEGWWSGKSR